MIIIYLELLFRIALQAWKVYSSSVLVSCFLLSKYTSQITESQKWETSDRTILIVTCKNYEICPKSNDTGVIQTIEFNPSQIPSK